MMRKALIAGLAVLAGCSGQPQSHDKPGDFALALAVEPAPGGKVQRLSLPPAAVAALQREDRGDFRLFDSAGRQLSLAIDPGRADAALPSENAVPITPIAMPRGQGPGGVTVRVEQGAQDVTVDAVNAEAASESSPLAALLLDTRKLADPAIEVRLIVELPRDRLVEINVEQSGDLKTWTPLASRQLVRFPGQDGSEVISAIPLGGTVLKDSYLRISWQVASDVLIRTARVVTAKEAPPPPLTFATTGAKMVDQRTIALRVPPGMSAARLRVTGSGRDGVLPLSLEGRRNAESPWQGWDGATLRDGQSVELALPGAGMGEYRLLADPRSAGFFAMPRIELLVDPVNLLAAFAGTPPYTLAAGNRDAASDLLSPGELLGAASPASLPGATVSAGQGAPTLSLAPAEDQGTFSPRKLALWAALLAATAVLALAAWRLMKANSTKPEGTDA